MNKYVFLIAVVLMLSCNDDKKAAQESLNKAKALYENAEYGGAKQMLDELKSQHPKQLALQKEGLHLMRLIDLKEQERNLAYCDSMIVIRQAEVDSIKQYFIFEKDPQYDEKGKYIEKKMAASLSSQKLRVGVNEDGDIYLISTYSGGSSIKHNQLKVLTPSGEYAETEAIPFDGGANYSFKDDNTGLIHELVTYQKGRDNGVIRFIDHHSNEKLTAQYLGGKNHSYVIPKSVIESLGKSLDLSITLLDVEQLQKEKEKAEHRLEYLRSKVIEN